MPVMPRRKRKQFYVRRKVCRFCVDANLPIDYKDCQHPEAVCHGAGQDHSPANFGKLRPPPAAGHQGHQASPAAGPDSVHPHGAAT